MKSDVEIAGSSQMCRISPIETTNPQTLYTLVPPKLISEYVLSDNDGVSGRAAELAALSMSTSVAHVKTNQDSPSVVTEAMDRKHPVWE